MALARRHLIKVLLGLVRITAARARCSAIDIGRQARSIRTRVGYMPEDDCYIAGLSGVEMVRFIARLSGLPSVEALRRSHEILDFCGIEQERYRDVETYSTGMRQKLKFAQAIVHDPPLLILDEPTSGLDPEERQAMLSRIGVLARRGGKTVLLSTHILPDVQATCANVVILARGRVRIVEQLDVLSKPSSPAFHVRVLGPPDALLSRLQRRRISRRAGAGWHAHRDRGRAPISPSACGSGHASWVWDPHAWHQRAIRSSRYSSTPCGRKNVPIHDLGYRYVAGAAGRGDVAVVGDRGDRHCAWRGADAGCAAYSSSLGCRRSTWAWRSFSTNRRPPRATRIAAVWPPSFSVSFHAGGLWPTGLSRAGSGRGAAHDVGVAPDDLLPLSSGFSHVAGGRAHRSATDRPGRRLAGISALLLATDHSGGVYLRQIGRHLGLCLHDHHSARLGTLS